MSKFKTILNKKLKLNNISKNKFAKMIGVTSVYVGQLTRGERNPSKKLQIKIADIFYEKEKEKNNFLDNIAKETNDIPADIYNGILDNENEWNKVREFLKKENIVK
ncbi:MAG: helix-turn-helix transcriptional regulator [Clostridia bacterium]|nr:helix-turn-helix transcriptional regulator [Clostridia bacterium]